MRTFINGAGLDVTSSVLSYLAASNEFRFADLYLIGEAEDPNAQWLTDWESSLTWSPWGAFHQTVIKRAKINSTVGLTVTTLEIEWSPQLGSSGVTTATANPYQLARNGFYDNWRVRLWRCVMPTPGDANTYGACEYFGGWVQQTEVARGVIKFSCDSFLSVINQKVPPNVIESTNTLASFVGATGVWQDNEVNVPRFSVVAPTSANLILASCIAPSGGKIYGDNKLQYGFLVFDKGSTLEGFWSAVSNNGHTAGPGTIYNQIGVFSPFPWPPTPGDTFYVATQFPINQTDGQYFGFPYVPAPEQAL